MSSIAESLERVAREYGVVALYAFGSRGDEIAARVRGKPVPPGPPASDVDIAVQIERGRGLSGRERVTLTIALEDLLEVGRVDLVVLAEADPFLALDVIRGELLYCADPDHQAEDELYVLRRAGDLARYARERQDLVLAEGAR
jgi:predicted nucleotidyltransferase